MSASPFGPVWADVGPPPTFLIDSVWLGPLVGPVVGAALLAAAITGFFWLRRRINRFAAGFLCLLLYAAANFGIYLLALGQAAERRDEYRRRHQAVFTNPATSQATGPTSAR